MGAFLNENDDILGINTFSTQDVYSPNKIRNLIVKNMTSNLEPVTDEKISELTGWWNSEVIGTYTERNTILSDYDDIELTMDELKEYFVETIEEFKGDEELQTEGYRTKWYTYYLNPSMVSGLSVKLGNHTVIDYDSANINKIMIMESENSEYKKTIMVYDEKEKWVEDNDIHTNLDWNEIRFIFERGDLENASTAGMEKQAYVELYEKLNPWDSKEESKEIISKWLSINQHYLE